MAHASKARLNLRSVIRLIAVIALAMFALGSLLPELTWVWNPTRYGDYGIAVYDSSDVSVDSGSAAWAAGIRTGDKIDYRFTSLRDRLILEGQGASAHPGEKLTLRVLRDNTARTITMVARPSQGNGFLDNIFLVGKRIGAVVFITVGAILVLLRPSRMMWAFFFFALGASAWYTTATFWSTILPIGWYAFIFLARFTLAAVTVPALLIVALRFPTDKIAGWRRWLEYSMPVLFLLIWVGWPYPYFKMLLLGEPSKGTPVIWLSPPMIGLAAVSLSVALLTITYLRSTGPDRHKLQWVILALGLFCFDLLMYMQRFFLPLYMPNWMISILDLLTILVPISVAYAVIRHRVFDITFVISRALVYTIITLIAVAVFSLIDLIFIKMLSSSALGFAADASAAIVMGISINKLHGRLDYVIDGLFFRQHHRAEQRIIGLVHELPHARSNDTVNRMLVTEPVEALKLTSGAVFRRSGKGPYVRQLAVGWPKTGYLELAADDPLVVQLRNLHAATRMPEVRRSSLELPMGDAHPVLALPIVARNELLAFALYGPHGHGTDLDPDEVKAISGLAVGAAVAYEHLEAEALRREIERVRLEYDAFKKKAQAPNAGAGDATPSLPPATA